MTTTVTQHDLQIQRLVASSGGFSTAAFFVGEVELCRAWFGGKTAKQVFVFEVMGVDVERAKAISVAIQLAIDWLTEQS